MNTWKSTLILFLAALGFRILTCVVFANEIIPGPDQMQEIMLGRSFADGNYGGVLDTYWAPAYPILIGLASSFIDSVTLPALTVSILAGAAAVSLTYFLALQSYSNRDAWIAAIFAIFFPHLINSIVAIGSENLYIVWVLCSLITGWEAIKRNSVLWSVSTGLFVGLAYLTRPEAIGYLIFFLFAIIAYDQFKTRSVLRDTIPKGAALIVAAALLAAPYVVYLHGETGEWSISGKSRSNTIAGHIVEEYPLDEIEPDKHNKPVSVFIKYFVINLIEANKVFPILIPSLLFVLIGLAMFTSPWNNERLFREAYLMIFCIVTLVGYAAAIVQLRYFYVLLPVFFCWMARGTFIWAGWLRGSISNGKWPRLFSTRILVTLCVLAIFLYVLPLNFYMRPADDAWSSRAYEERDAGLWLRQHDPSEPLIFSASFRPVFYAQGRALPPKTKDMSQILDYILSNQADYVVVSERSLKRHPYLKDLELILQRDSRFELIYEQEIRKGNRMSIYRLRSVPL
jgi:4-amino-4-deoxy-L-arabinose transferase-like glycosyltransferase